VTAAAGARPMDLSIILVSYNTADLLAQCLERLRAAAPALQREIIVVDNASHDRSAELIRTQHPECRLIENRENLGFGRANNQALHAASGRYVLLVNPDVLVEPDSIAKTVAYMEAHPACGILGVRLVGPDGRLQPSARYFPTPWNVFLQRAGLERFFKGTRTIDEPGWDHASVRHCDWVPGCFYLVRKALIDQVGLFDPRFFLYYEEVDHCRAAKKAGWEVVFYPGTSAVHLQGQSALHEGEFTHSGHAEIIELRTESELLYFRKNHGIAGMLMHLLLASLAAAILVLKRLLKRNAPPELGAQARQVALAWSLVRRTAWGTRPTR